MYPTSLGTAYSRNLPHDPSLVALRGETALKLYPRNNARGSIGGGHLSPSGYVHVRDGIVTYPFWRRLRAKRLSLIDHHSPYHICSILILFSPTHPLKRTSIHRLPKTQSAENNSRSIAQLHIFCTLASMYIQQRIKFRVHTSAAYPNTLIRGEREKKTIRKKKEND